uniref:Uncharacterized protein n=1 Tax=Dreissena rostriformis TaxID=205083 RepID=A0A894JH87_9BIVA|nr:hypothetical protein K8L31_mgp14 [Dreissena rostriformis]QRV59728.1 hypothetical protein [Dreissena rostriformis]
MSIFKMAHLKYMMFMKMNWLGVGALCNMVFTGSIV